MLLQYLVKFQKSIFMMYNKRCYLKAYHVCQTIKCFMSYGTINTDTVTIVAYSVYDMPQTCSNMPMPLIKCTVYNALVSATVLHQTCTSVHWRYTTVADKLMAGWHPILFIAVDQAEFRKVRLGRVIRALFARKFVQRCMLRVQRAASNIPACLNKISAISKNM